MTPCLIASASPARRCSGGSVASTLDVGDDRGRLMKRADEILARRRVDAGLAADRRVDHREQARRHLHVRHAAHERRGDEAGEVADHAAAERDDRRVAPEAGGEQLVGERAQVSRVLCASPAGIVNTVDSRRAERVARRAPRRAARRWRR